MCSHWWRCSKGHTDLLLGGRTRRLSVVWSVVSSGLMNQMHEGLTTSGDETLQASREADGGGGGWGGSWGACFPIRLKLEVFLIRMSLVQSHHSLNIHSSVSGGFSSTCCWSDQQVALIYDDPPEASSEFTLKPLELLYQHLWRTKWKRAEVLMWSQRERERDAARILLREKRKTIKMRNTWTSWTFLFTSK